MLHEIWRTLRKQIPASQNEKLARVAFAAGAAAMLEENGNIEKSWRGFQAEVKRDIAIPSAERLARDAYYAGASHMWSAVMACGIVAESDTDLARRINALKVELIELQEKKQCKRQAAV